MALTFEWDQKKAASNLRKHGVSFTEAATAFGDPLSVTILDPDHALEEDRFILIGESQKERLLVVAHTERSDTIRIIAPAWQRGARGRPMRNTKKKTSVPEMRDEYDFSKGVRGKYAKRFAMGSNIVVLDPDVARLYPDSKTVNDTLRALVRLAPQRKTKAG